MRVFCFESVDSTNEAAKRLLAAGVLSESACVMARGQSAGRGTGGREWVSPSGAGIYLSVVDLRRGRVGADFRLRTMAAGAACAEVLARVTGVEAALKPVNDLMVGDGKLGGILVEAIVEGGEAVAVVTGIGINVGHAERALGAGAARAVCLEALMERVKFSRVDWTECALGMARETLKWHAMVEGGGKEEVLSAYRRRLAAGWGMPI